jgi:hypothetical protein
MGIIRRNVVKTPLEDDIGSAVYLHVRNMVAAIVNRAARFGVDWIEAESAANLAVAEAIVSFQPEKGDPVAWIMLNVRYAIYDLRRYKTTAALPLASDPDQFDPPAPSDDEDDTPFDLTGALLGLSEDAVMFVTITLDPPASVLETARRLGWSESKGCGGIDAAKYRQAVFSFLKESGWSNRRTTNAYLEACSKLGGDKK